MMIQHSTEFMTYKVLKTTVILFLLGYFSVGVSAYFLKKGTEDFYPFFSWFLFNEVPKRNQVDFDLVIRQTGTEKFESGIFFEEAVGVYENRLHPMHE